MAVAAAAAGKVIDKAKQNVLNRIRSRVPCLIDATWLVDLISNRGASSLRNVCRLKLTAWYVLLRHTSLGLLVFILTIVSYCASESRGSVVPDR